MTDVEPTCPRCGHPLEGLELQLDGAGKPVGHGFTEMVGDGLCVSQFTFTCDFRQRWWVRGLKWLLS